MNQIQQQTLFGTSGIRGVFGKDLYPKTALKVGLAFSEFLNHEGEIVVAHDVRHSSIPLKNALVAGLLSGGIDVIDIGLAPTPAALYTIKEYKTNGAVVITGSHTPYNINGILLFLSDTAEIYGEAQKAVERIYQTNSFSYANSRNIGHLSEEDYFDIYLDAIQNSINVRKITGTEIVIDPGNGSMSKVMGDILELLDVNVIRINDSPNGLFPNRDPYPRKENLHNLSKISSDTSIVGVATDGDGDRAIFVDENGAVIDGDIIGMLFALNEFKKIKAKNKIIVTPINSSFLVEELAQAYNISVFYTKVGPPNIIEGIKKVSAPFGFEETGKYIWAAQIFYGDSLFSSIKLLEILNNENAQLSQVISSFPKYFSMKIAISCPDEYKDEVLTWLLKTWEQAISKKNIVTIDKTDGLKIILKKNRTWILFRPSGTEPVFRVYVNGKNKTFVENLASNWKLRIENYIHNLKKKQE